MSIVANGFDPVDDMVDLPLAGPSFHDNDHLIILLAEIKKATVLSSPWPKNKKAMVSAYRSDHGLRLYVFASTPQATDRPRRKNKSYKNKPGYFSACCCPSGTPTPYE
jgi:hypothetical protein